MAEEEQELPYGFPLAEPGRRQAHGHQGTNHTKKSTYRFPFLKAESKEAGLTFEGKHLGE